MRVKTVAVCVVGAVAWLLLPSSAFNKGASAGGNQAAPAAVRSATPTGAAPQKKTVPPPVVDRSQENVEKETSLKMKEQELRKVSRDVDARLKELQEAEKTVEAAMASKKKTDSERSQKVMKLYKKLRPEDAARLIDKLEEDLAFQLLDQMDQKTAAKIIPLMNQQRVLKWTRLALKNH